MRHHFCSLPYCTYITALRELFLTPSRCVGSHLNAVLLLFSPSGRVRSEELTEWASSQRSQLHRWYCILVAQWNESSALCPLILEPRKSAWNRLKKVYINVQYHFWYLRNERKLDIEVAQWLACWAHNPEVPCSIRGFDTSCAYLFLPKPVMGVVVPRLVNFPPKLFTPGHPASP